MLVPARSSTRAFPQHHSQMLLVFQAVLEPDTLQKLLRWLQIHSLYSLAQGVSHIV